MTDESKTPPDGQPNPLPSTDLLDDEPVWTPEIERLTLAIAEQIRIDSPGMIVSGPQRSGKSSACRYLKETLPEALGYPVCSVLWSIPQEPSKTTRLFIQERMLQSDCMAINHRDLAVLRVRLHDHLADLAASAGTRRVIIIIDEAQCLSRDEYAMLVYIFNELERRRLRPFVLLVGQPSRSPLRLTSRLIVDGARPRRTAVDRIDSPATIALEISSRSASVSAVGARDRSAGRIPPVSASIWWIDECGRSKSLPISCSVAPCFQRSHINAFWLAE